MSTHHELVTRALDLLAKGLFPFVEQEMKRVHGTGWTETAASSFRTHRGPDREPSGALKWDAHALLTVMWDQWNPVFRDGLQHFERSLVSELREFRNRWAHQQPFDADDTYRVLDSIQRLLSAVNAEDEAQSVAALKQSVLREVFVQEEDLESRQRHLRRKRRWLAAIYAACGAMIVATILRTFGTSAWYLAAFVVVVFAYLIWTSTRGAGLERPGLLAVERDVRVGL